MSKKQTHVLFFHSVQTPVDARSIWVCVLLYVFYALDDSSNEAWMEYSVEFL